MKALGAWELQGVLILFLSLAQPFSLPSGVLIAARISPVGSRAQKRKHSRIRLRRSHYFRLHVFAYATLFGMRIDASHWWNRWVQVTQLVRKHFVKGLGRWLGALRSWEELEAPGDMRAIWRYRLDR